MSDAPKTTTENNDTYTPKKNGKFSQLIFTVLAVFIAFYLFRDLERFKNIAIVVVGFAIVIFVHELGHFVAAKSVGIMVEAFSLGFGPVVFGIRRVQGAFLVRVLPTLIPGDDNNGKFSFKIPFARAKEGETEYRISLVPLGGFVKMLGQEDIAADKPSDNPRAYPNKPVWARSIVIAAGVTMNVIFGAIVFIAVFAHGVPLPPAVIGSVTPGSPAAQAGIQAGDEVIAIGDLTQDLTFKDIMLAGIFSEPCQPIPITVRHPDQTVESFEVLTVMNENAGNRVFGITPPTTLTIGIPNDADDIKTALEEQGIQPRDTIIAIDHQPITHGYQYQNIMFPQPNTATPAAVTLTFQRPATASDPCSTYDFVVPMSLAVGTEIQPGSLFGLLPQLVIKDVLPDSPAQQAGLQPEDIVTRTGDIQYPTATQFGQYCQSHPDQTFIIAVQRPSADDPAAEILLEVTPRVDKPKGLIGLIRSIFAEDPPARIGVMLGQNYRTNTVNRVLTPTEENDDEDQTPSPFADLNLPATITTVNDQPVTDLEQLTIALNQLRGQTVEITFTSNDPETQTPTTQVVALDVPESTDQFAFQYLPNFGSLPDLPLTQLEYIYRGESFSHCLALAAKTTYSWIAQNYMFIRGMFTRQVSAAAASGPVGILRISYTIASEKSLTFYCYFMAIISIALAVFNFLPLPILDGGHFVMLIIEKIKGSPVPIKIQEIVTYVGLALILSFALFVTYNDIIKWATGQI
ncbi:MAG: site-2 protease family protein [Sedimentisphaerales bacterium]|nr:site-2 protease family protein [Sedimentisphaerales bacterium]